MAETTAFALRMPPEIKTAAKSLTKVLFHEPSIRGEGYVNSIFLGSINDALCYLLKTGLKETLVHLDSEIAEYTDRVAVMGEWMAWFLQNPAASSLLPHNLPEGSKGRRGLEERMAPVEYGSADSEAGEEFFVEENPWPGGISRREVTGEYANEQRMLYSLTEAKGAIQKALAT